MLAVVDPEKNQGGMKGTPCGLRWKLTQRIQKVTTIHYFGKLLHGVLPVLLNYTVIGTCVSREQPTQYTGWMIRSQVTCIDYIQKGVQPYTLLQSH